MQLEKMRARLERGLAEVEEWRRVASEGELHRRRASEVWPRPPFAQPPPFAVLSSSCARRVPRGARARVSCWRRRLTWRHSCAVFSQLAQKHSLMQERLEEVEQREVAVEREATHVRALQQQLLGQHPDLHRLSEMMSERQREEREARDAKVLRVLRTKDQSIATLNGQVQGLERSLDETRAKLGAADRALEDKHKEMERASRDHQASLASAQVSLVFPRSRLPPAWPHSLLFELGGSIVGERRQALVCCPDSTPLVSSPHFRLLSTRVVQLKWREAQEEVLGLRAKLNDMQAASVQSDSLGRQLADSERAKAALEIDVSQLLRDRSELQDRHAALQAQARQAEAKDRTIRDLQQQVEQQSVGCPLWVPASGFLPLRSCLCRAVPSTNPRCVSSTHAPPAWEHARARSLCLSLSFPLSLSRFVSVGFQGCTMGGAGHCRTRTCAQGC